MKLALVLSGLVGLIIAPNLSAQNIIVGWGGNSVSSTQPLNGFTTQSVFGNNGTYNANPTSRTGRLGAANVDNILTDAIIGIPFSGTTQLSPTSGYTGQRFFGGAMANVITPGVTTPSIDNLQIRNSGTSDVLDFRFQLSSKLHDSRVAVFFDKSDFLAGGNSLSQFVQLGPNSTLGVTIGNSTSQQANRDAELRWIAREGGQWWISASNAQGDPNVISADGGGSNPIQNGNVLTSTVASGALRYWALYNPLPGGGLPNFNWEPTYTSRFVITNPSSVFIRDLTLNPFTNIDGLGFYIEGDQLATNVFQFEVRNIDFNVLLAVPEPTTYAMIAVMGVGYFAFRNFRRKKPVTPETAGTEPTEFQPEPTPAPVA